MLYRYLIVIICCLFSAFFSCSDIVYAMVDQDRLEREITEHNSKTAKLALKLAKNYEFSVSSILFGNNVVNILGSSMVTLIGLSINPNDGATIASAIFLIILIIFCEFLPKAFGKRFNYFFAKAFAYPVTICLYITFIFVWPISKIFKLIGKAFTKKGKEEDKIDEDVLTEMADTLEEKGGLEEDEAEVVRNAIDLNDIQAYEVMTPRVDVFAIDVEENIEDIFKDEELFTHSRVPVYEDTIDNIIGILPVKKLAKARLNNENIDIKKLMYKPIYIPRNHQILDLLNEFKNSKVHIAVILDEYGGTEGIVTMEDILEQIVGDIFDELDEVEPEYVKLNESTYVIDGSMNIDDFFELINFDAEKNEFETDYSTAGGFIQEVLDRFANVGDKFDFYNYSIEVLEADKYTVEKFKIVIHQIEEE